MVKKNKITSLIVFGGLMCLVPAALADCTQTASTACMSLISAGNYIDFAGVYVGPYAASINGGTATPVICDDYLDDSYLPEYWTADIIQGSSSSSFLAGTRDATSTKTGSIGPSLVGPALQQAYDEVGYLALELLNTSPADGNTMGAIHFALWSVFDPGALNVLNTGTNGNYAAAVSKLNDAINVVTGVDGYNNGKGDQGSNYSSYISQFTIYSPDPSQQTCLGTPLTCSVTTSVNNPPQEFLVRTPESPFFALLGVDLSGLGAVIFLLRRRRNSRP